MGVFTLLYMCMFQASEMFLFYFQKEKLKDQRERERERVKQNNKSKYCVQFTTIVYDFVY